MEGGWSLPPEKDGWRGEIMRQLQPALKRVFATARRMTGPAARARKPFSIHFSRRYKKKGARGKPVEVMRMDERHFGEFVELLDRYVFRALVDPDTAPREWSVEVEVFGGWERWVLYIR